MLNSTLSAPRLHQISELVNVQMLPQQENNFRVRGSKGTVSRLSRLARHFSLYFNSRLRLYVIHLMR
jgi:hypothetical protein